MSPESFSSPRTENDTEDIADRLKVEIVALGLNKPIDRKRTKIDQFDDWFDDHPELKVFFADPDGQNWATADMTQIERKLQDIREYIQEYREAMEVLQKTVSQPLTQRILRGVFVDWPQMDRARFYKYGWDACYYVAKYQEDLLRGSVAFLADAYDYEVLNGITKELKTVAQHFSEADVLKFEEEFRAWKKKDSQKQQRESKKELFQRVIGVFSKKRKLFVALLLDLTIPVVSGLERSDQKKFENQVQNISPNELERVLARYHQVVEKTKQLGGSEIREEELLLGLEELNAAP